MKRTVHLPLHIPTLIFAAVTVGLYVFFTQFVFAHGGDTSLLHACVKTSNPPGLGSIRMILPNGNCNANETAVDWAKGTNLPPFMCPRCDFNSFGNIQNLKLAGKDLTNSFLPAALLYDADLSGTIFINTELSGATLDNTNFSNANLSGAYLQSIHAQAANFSNANLTNADFTGAYLTGAINMDTATRTGIIWSNTTCPDGTNSDSNGNTCEGHLIP